jgi:hypothetical protein
VRRVALLLWAGCGFAPSATTDAGGVIAVDAATCSKLVASGGTPALTLGGNGGIAQADLVCASGELPIGISVTTTMGTRAEGGNGGERVVTAISVLCGAATMATGGPLVTTAAETIGWTGNACGWGPFVTTPIVPCPDNTMLVGLTANGGQTTLFNTVSLTCALVKPDDTIGPVVAPRPVADSGSYSNHMQAANCPAGQVVTGFKNQGNCGVDGLTPVCAPLQCK